jgi:hypothetical protein
MQSDQVSATVWRQIPPPPDGITVAFFDNATVQVGLNQVYADSQNLTHRWRSFIPWMSSGIVSVFPFSRAIQSPASRMPLFYVGHTAAALDASKPDAQWVHLVRADTKHNQRDTREAESMLSLHRPPCAASTDSLLGSALRQERELLRNSMNGDRHHRAVTR